MFCDECEKVLNLDTSFPVASDDNDSEESQQVAHHASYSDLSRAASAGCELCRHISQNTRGASDTPTSDSPSDPRNQITFEVFNDSLNFNIPIRIQYDDSGQNYDFGEESVKVYISTEES